MLHGLLLVAFAIDSNSVSTDGCGIPVVKPRLVEPRIIGGIEAIPGSWPWTVGLYRANVPSQLLQDSDAYNCVGALINEQTVVTAAHCLARMAPADIDIMLGAHDRSKQEAGRKQANVSRICIHPGWVPSKSNDIGLVKLSSAVQFSKTIQAVCLSSGTSPVVKPNDDLFVIGWGITDPLSAKASSVLKQARQTLIAREKCAKLGRPELSSILCANHDHGSTCKGDSGGPLVLRINETWYLEGIVSAGPAFCGSESSPLYYTQVSAYKDWILKILKNFSDEGLCRPADFSG